MWSFCLFSLQLSLQKPPCKHNPLLLHALKNSKTREISWPLKKKLFPLQGSSFNSPAAKVIKFKHMTNYMKWFTGMSRSVRYIHTHLAPPGFYVSWKKALKLLLSHFPVRNGCSIAGAIPHQEDEAISQQRGCKMRFSHDSLWTSTQMLQWIWIFPQLKELLSTCRCGSTAGAAHLSLGPRSFAAQADPQPGTASQTHPGGGSKKIQDQWIIINLIIKKKPKPTCRTAKFLCSKI